ncbi:polysaccharide deacetylase family protein [Ruminococcus sp.]|uniref:polysaccharide deacetylase family protein n=1 Tax=Ruminococcus sp. TaxID=41978 RepID=UPI0038647910
MGKYNDDFFIDFEDISSEGQERRREYRSNEYRRRDDRRSHDFDRNEPRYPDRRQADPGRTRRPANVYDDRRDYNRFRDDDRPGYHRNRIDNRCGYERRRDDDRRYDRQRDAYRAERSQPRSDPRYRDWTPENRRRKKPNMFRVAVISVALLLVIVIIGGIIAGVSAASKPAIHSLTVSEVAADQVLLSWEKVNKVDGYRVMMAKGDADLEEYQTINDPDTVTAAVTGLEQASSYRFAVTTLRGNKAGKPTETDPVHTLPASPEITTIQSLDPGTIHLEWSKNDSANGYLVEYKKNTEDYSSDSTMTISDPAQCSADIADLAVDTDYTVRVSATADLGGTVKSAPSPEQTVTVTAKKVEPVPKAADQKADAAIDPDKPMIALTFDDGPAVNTDSSDRILDVLEKNNAKASFFMVGYYASQNPDNVKRKAELKMELGNHTWDHSRYGNEVTPDDIRRTSNQIHDITGQFSTCFRSPGGMTTPAILTECAEENMAAYYWSIDTQDWNSRNADAVYHSVMDNVKDGDIILMHEIYDSTADAVERMVPELIAQGYQLVTCHDLITLKGGAEPVPGTQYVNAFTKSEF